MFFAGFSCQAFSTMRGKDLTKRPPQMHDKFMALPVVVEFVKKVQPRAAFLENTLGLGRHWHQVESDGITIKRTGMECLREELRNHYYISWTTLDAAAWVTVRRPRIWMFLVHVDCGTQDMADDASHRASAIQARRAEREPTRLHEYTFARGTDDWSRIILAGQAGQLEPRARCDSQAQASWRRQANAQRQEWRNSGIQGHDAHPLAMANLRGMRGTEREREVLEVFLISSCLQQGLSPATPDDLKKAKQNLTADISQNLSWLRPDRGHVAGVFCTKSRVYSFAEDHLLHPVELLGSMGWKTSTTGPNINGLTVAELQDLVGECQALQCLGAATWALILALGSALPGAWGNGS